MSSRFTFDRRKAIKLLTVGVLLPLAAALPDLPEFRSIVVGRGRDGIVYWEPGEFSSLRPGDWFYFTDEPTQHMYVLDAPFPVEPAGNWAVNCVPDTEHKYRQHQIQAT